MKATSMLILRHCQKIIENFWDTFYLNMTWVEDEAGIGCNGLVLQLRDNDLSWFFHVDQCCLLHNQNYTILNMTSKIHSIGPIMRFGALLYISHQLSHDILNSNIWVSVSVHHESKNILVGLISAPLDFPLFQ